MNAACAETHANVVGFLIRDTEADSTELLTLEPGMSVLYGLNGAGKSRTLDDIRRFWDGVWCTSLALIQLPEEPPDIDWNRETERGDWFPDWAWRAGASSAADGDDVLRRWLEACLSVDDSGMAVGPSAKDRLHDLVEEWMRQRLILVRSIGSASEKRWVSAPAFLSGQDHPAVRREVELYENVARHDAWDERVDEILLTPYGITADGQTIACASLYGTPVMDSSQWAFSAGQHDRVLDVSPTLLLTGPHLDDRTRVHLLEHVRRLVTVLTDEALPSEELTRHVRRLERDANNHYSRVLQDAPTLRLHVNPLGLNRQVEWFVESDDGLLDSPEDAPIAVDPDDRARTLSELSPAQRKWATWSIGMALQGINAGGAVSVPRLILLDEPEAALHRSAESRMADYLGSLVTDDSTCLLLATHSPELLDLQAARVYEVARRQGRRQLSPLTGVTRENMHELGLLPSDLLRRQRGFVLVEGQHDELVLEALFGAEFREFRVEILPMRGTRQLSPAKIEFLFDYTPAHVFIMLDNVKTDAVMDVWQRALQQYRDGIPQKAINELKHSECLQTEEGRKLREVLQSALDGPRAERLSPHGLSRLDVIEYLPVGALVPGAGSWVELRSCHKRERQERPKTTEKDFKMWLTRQFGADFSDHAISNAIQRLDEIPPDLLRLFHAVEDQVKR